MGAGDGEAAEPVRAAGEAGSAYADVTWSETSLRPTALSMARAESHRQRLAELAAVRDLQRGGETDRGWRRVCNAQHSRATSTETELSNYTLTDSVYMISAVAII